MHIILVRHGQSVANQEAIVCSSMENGTDSKYGLTTEGVRQAHEGAEVLRSIVGKDFSGLVIYTSPFTRAIETATILAKGTGVSPRVVADLRERCFGSYELGPDEHAYRATWALDASRPDHTVEGVESVTSVASRCARVLALAAREAPNTVTHVVFVAHGDVLQIMQCVVSGVAVSLHRSLPHLNQAEVRVMNPKSNL